MFYLSYFISMKCQTIPGVENFAEIAPLRGLPQMVIRALFSNEWVLPWSCLSVFLFVPPHFFN